MNFVDSYKYAAYALAELIGMDDLLPVYVERTWQGNPGSLSWWLPVKMDAEDRIKQKVVVPDPDAWDKQMYKIRVFDQLVYDADPYLTNVLIGEDFKIWRVDFSRGFRLYKANLSEDSHCSTGRSDILPNGFRGNVRHCVSLPISYFRRDAGHRPAIALSGGC